MEHKAPRSVPQNSVYHFLSSIFHLRILQDRDREGRSDPSLSLSQISVSVFCLYLCLMSGVWLGVGDAQQSPTPHSTLLSSLQWIRSA